MMETMIPPQVGMRLRTKIKKAKVPKIIKEAKDPNEKNKKMREKERRNRVTILFHTCALK